MSKVENCPICLKHTQSDNKNNIYEDDHITVYHGPVESNLIGYLYIEPKRHVENWYEMTEQEILKMSQMIKKLSGILKKEIDADRVYTVTISEAVRHLHIHIIPRVENEVVKGLKLIEQVTQQKSDSDNGVSQKDIDVFISELKSKMIGFK